MEREKEEEGSWTAALNLSTTTARKMSWATR
jgi:hypothetical protein